MTRTQGIVFMLIGTIFIACDLFNMAGLDETATVGDTWFACGMLMVCLSTIVKR